MAEWWKDGNSATSNYLVTVAGDLDKVYRYDLNGNCTNVSMARTNIWYEFDAENRVVALNTYITNTATLKRTELTYDGFDRWVQIAEKTNGVTGSTKRFVWCGGSTPCEERDGSNAVQKRFFAEGEQIGSANFFYLRDYLGSIQQVIDGTGAVRAQYDYDPYGNQTKVQGDMDADFGFAGYYRHAASGLYLTMFRAYDPDSGRWINRDPIEEEGGLNLYEYVGNDVVNDVDPDGEFALTEILVGIGLVALAATAYLKYQHSKHDTDKAKAQRQKQKEFCPNDWIHATDNLHGDPYAGGPNDWGTEGKSYGDNADLGGMIPGTSPNPPFDPDTSSLTPPDKDVINKGNALGNAGKQLIGAGSQDGSSGKNN
ncbi:MAG TPA: RHS repeat-associated core domain-containing protein [Verrucomicrobiae bacterium]|nr:RHS repeat-associated core domain-containing protein [Verrucomicrobiae bacterium]